MSDHHEKKKARRNNPLLPIAIVLAITTLVSTVLCIYTIYSHRERPETHVLNEDPGSVPVSYTQSEIDSMISDAKEQASIEKEQALKSFIKSYSMSQGANLAELLRRMYPEYIVCLTSSGYKFTSINKNYDLAGIPSDTLIFDENGVVTQTVGDTVKSKKGIDVSEYQGKIDWKKVKESGVDFAFIRAGYRGYVSGKLVEDEQYINNVKGCIENDIEVGVYYFSQAVTEEEIEEEVDTMLVAIAEYEVTGPIVIDIEKVDSNNSRGNALSQEERTKLVLHFCDYVRSKGYEPMIYGNTYSFFEMLDIDQVHDERIWYAFYDTYLYYPYKLDIWQYSAKMNIPGIEGDVDIDIMFNCN